ncbi:MAG: tetratricopeptide repeat protein, partial [Candidatus Hodarchaeota archaeon]
MTENISHSEPKELSQVKKLIDECKLDEADQIIKSFEEKGGHSLHDIVLCHLLKCELLGERGLFEDLVKLAEQTYKESLGLGKNLLSVDILLRMAEGQSLLIQPDKSHEIIKRGEDLLKTLTKELPADYKQREAYIAYLKGWYYIQKLNADQALKQFELSFSLREELGVKKEIAYSLVAIARILIYEREFNRALKYLEQGLVLAEESGNKSCIGYCLHIMAWFHIFKGELDRSIMLDERSLKIFNELNNKFWLAGVLNSLAASYAMKGELDRSIRFYEQNLELCKELNNKGMMAIILNGLSGCYKMKGELDSALECIEQSMAIFRELGALGQLANTYDYLIQILIYQGDFERARISLHDLEQLNSQLKDKQTNLMYLMNKALLLKTSSRALNRGKAEEILKQLLEEEDLIYESRLLILLNLCELLLADLRISNEAEILEEIKPLITQLLTIAEKSHSYLVFCETFILQAKLALVNLDIKAARRFLTQAQKLAESYGIKRLAIKISYEHDELLKQLEIWEKLKESKAPLAERMELSRLNEQMEGMVKKRVGKIPKLEAEQPVLLTVMSKDGNTLLSNPFTADLAIDSIYFSEFLSSCTTFCDQILSESFDRVK